MRTRGEWHCRMLGEFGTLRPHRFGLVPALHMGVPAEDAEGKRIFVDVLVQHAADGRAVSPPDRRYDFGKYLRAHPL